MVRFDQGGKWGIDDTEEKIWKETSYVCIRRGELAGGGLRMEQGTFSNGGLTYFGKNGSSFSATFDERRWSSFPLEIRYLEVNSLVGSHQFIAPFDMYEALMGAHADISDDRKRNIFYIG